MMTRDEIIKEYEAAVAAHAAAAAAGIKGAGKSYELFKAGLDALRPVSREEVKKLFSGCINSHDEEKLAKHIHCYPSFCPVCGKPLTDKAVDMVMRRLEALYEEI